MVTEVIEVTDDVTISVVVACFDAEAVLPDQLAALARQRDAGRWELVLSDNGSRDGTRAVADRFAAEHPQLRVTVVDSSARRGPGAARNAGVAAATGQVVAFCDADDVVADDWVAQVRSGAAQHAFFAGRFEEARLNPAWLSLARGAGPEHGLQRADGPPGLPFSGAGNLVLRRALFDAVGGFDPRCPVLEDNDLCWRVQLATGEPLAWWPAAVVHVRLRSTLTAMFHQARTYGESSRWLQARYAAVPPPSGAAADAAQQAAQRSRGAAEPASARPWWFPERPLSRAGLGSALWQLGWRTGRLSGGLRMRAPGAVPPPLELGQLLRTAP